MSHDPHARPSTPWAPTADPTRGTGPQPTPRPSADPAGAPTPPAGSRPVFGASTYPAASPPVAGTTWSGSASAPPTTWQPPPERPSAAGSAAPAASGRAPRRRGGSLVAVAAIAALVAGAAGGAIGATVADQADDAASGSDTPAQTPVTTAVPPVEGDAAEPAAAVAAALGPAVVQIETGTGLGSGFVYDASGLVMTAHHVIEGSDQVQVRLADGTRLDGDVLGSDPATDVAVVQIDPPADVAVATLATGVTIEVGQQAIAIGSPFGLDQTVTSGIVSAVGRSSQTPGGVIPAIQTDTPINSGNSGGALADRQGRIIGINDSIITGGGDSTGNVGVGFAIPIDIAKGVADRIVAGESTDSAFLGVEGADATGSRAGAAITVVSQGSPADEAGLSRDDVVVSVDGEQVSSMIDLAAKIRTHQPGETVVLQVQRDGQEREVSVTLTAAPPG